MNDEVTKWSELNWLRGWVLYDGDCRFCLGWISRFEKALTRRGFDVAPLQSPWVVECLDYPEATALHEIKVLTTQSQVYGGAEAIIFLCRHIWWAWPVWWLGQIPGMRGLLRRGYTWIAAHRHCLPGSATRPIKY